MGWLRALAAAGGSLLLSGCLGVHYALQAGAGQFDLWAQARPIDRVIDFDRAPPRVRLLLAEVAGMKRFGEAHGLRATSSYQSYVQLDRQSVVYAVSACPELSLQAQVWRFPIVGSVPYLGWFSQRAAKEFAAGLRAEGLDVDVRGVAAYSTLGWFDDPVLSSMIGAGPDALGSLADTVLHESVHATVYVPGQAHFNEGLASFAGRRLAARYLEEKLGAGAPELRAFTARQPGGGKAERLHQAALQLEALYRDAALADDDKRARKQAILAALQAELKAARPLNNAVLAQHLTYRAGSGSEGFVRVLEACGGDWACFFRRLATLDPGDFSGPQQTDLDPLLAKLGRAG